MCSKYSSKKKFLFLINDRLRVFLLLVSFLLYVHEMTQGQTYATKSGKWSNTATWGGSAIPTATTVVGFKNNVTVMTDGANVCKYIISMANGSTISGTNTLTISAADTTLINGLATISCPLALGANNAYFNTTNSTDELTISGKINTGKIITINKNNGSGTIILSQNNSFTGGVTLDAGTLDINSASALGSNGAIFTINGGSMDNTSANNINTSNYPLVLNADFTYIGSFNNLNLGTGTTTINTNIQITVGGSMLTIGGAITAPTHDLTSTGGGTLSLGKNAVSIKNLNINGGTLIFAGQGNKSDMTIAGNVNISNGIATLFGTTIVPGTLTLNDTVQCSGTWGSTSSDATHKNSTYFASNGMLNIETSVCAQPKAANNGPVCAGATLSLTASTVNGATYNWTGPNGFTSTSQNPVVSISASPAMAGTYSVTDNLCTCTADTTNVKVKGSLPPTAGSNGPIICAGFPLMLTASPIPFASYSWTGPNSFTSVLQNPTVSLNATTAMSGTYSVTVSVNGCTSAAATTDVTVGTTSISAPVASLESSVCIGSTLTLLATTLTGATYSWTGPGGFTSSQQNPTVSTNATLAMSGTYYVTATQGTCTSPAGSITVNVNPVCQVPITSEGTDFWLAFMMNDDDTGNSVYLKVYITSKHKTNGTISLPLQSWSQPFSLKANQGTVIQLPTKKAYNSGSEIISLTGVHITSDSNITVWSVNNQNASADGSNILPTSVLGSNPAYIVSSYKGTGKTTNGLSEFVIVGVEDSSKISITPSANTSGGKPANVAFNINLNQGQTYEVQVGDTSDLTGSLVVTIKGNCALFCGTTCAPLPAKCSACDHLYKQSYPLNTWGKEYILTPFMYQVNGYVYKVVASEDSTTVNITGYAPFLLNKGGKFTADETTTATLYITADKAISVAQFMEGTTCNGFNDPGYHSNGEGDPSMLILNSNTQLQTEALFKTATTATMDTLDFVNILVKTVDNGSVYLDGKLIATSKFVQVPSFNTWSYAQMQIDTGIHTISSVYGFIAYAYGVGFYQSYAYSVGGDKNTISCNPVSIINQPLNTSSCSSGSVSFSVTTTGDGPFSYQWQLNNGIWSNVINGGSNPTYSGSSTSSLSVLNPAATLMYRCIASNCSPVNYTTSDAATLNFLSAPSPNNVYVIIAKNKGDSTSFSISPGGSNPFSFQWKLNGANIAGATNSILNLYPIACSDTGIYTVRISNVCDSAVAKVVNLYVLGCQTRVQHSISGNVIYDNADSTLMTNTTVYIKNSSDVVIDSIETAGNGFYIFNNLINGIYKLSCKTDKPLGGANPIDALIVNRYYIGLYKFTDSLKYHAGDVNSDGKKNPIDALLINRRYINLITSYPNNTPDWLFNNPTVTLGGVDLSKNIIALCYGDVNASYVPPARVMSYELGVMSNEIININPNQPFDIPVYLNDNVELGAIGLKIQVSSYPNPNPSPNGEGSANFKILGIKSDMEGLIYKITDEGVNIAWTTEDKGYMVNPAQPLFYITAISQNTLTPTQQIGHSLQTSASGENYLNNSFQITSESVLADIDVNAISTDKLEIPELVETTKVLKTFVVFIYPNPFSNITNINYSLPVDANVELDLYNVLGEKIEALVANELQQAGNHSLQYDASMLSQGVYYLRMQCNFSNSTYTKTNIMIITR